MSENLNISFQINNGKSDEGIYSRSDPSNNNFQTNLSVAVAATGFDFNHCFKKHKPMTFTSGNFECAHCGYRMERMRANFKAGHARYL